MLVIPSPTSHISLSLSLSLSLKHFLPPTLSLHPPLSPTSAALSPQLQNFDDSEYNPEDQQESEEEEELPEDWNAEQSNNKLPKAPKRRALIAGTPVTLQQYQNTLKEKIGQLFSHVVSEREEEQREQLEQVHPMVEDWVRVDERCVHLTHLIVHTVNVTP